MPVKFSNNAATTLAANATNSATTITVADGSVFPTLAGTDFTFITLEDVDSNREIVKLTAVSSNTLTIVRAQDGSSARAFSTDDKVELRLTAALLNAAVDSGAVDLKVNSYTGDGSTTAYNLSSSPALSSTLVYIDGVYQVKAAYAMSGQVLTLSSAPDSGALIEITAATVAPVQESTDFLINNFTGNGSTTAFTLSSTPTSENQTSVYLSGVYQNKNSYSVSGTTLTFGVAPPAVAIEVMVARTVFVTVGSPDNNSVSTIKIIDGAVTSAKLAAGAGGAFNNFLVKTANYTAVTRDQLIVNSSSAVTITLPASPAVGNVVFIKNAGSGTVTVARNGSNINSTADNGELAADAGASLVFCNSTIGWKEI